MYMSSFHESIRERLRQFHDAKKIPHILFCGPHGSGKRTLVSHFLHTIYDGNKDALKQAVMTVECSHGKGIKFVREELKLFAKTHPVLAGHRVAFKSIVLLNADQLTVDAQSALRRCIELYSYSTRFFLVVEDRSGLMKPILSRFSVINVPRPDAGGVSLCARDVESSFGAAENAKMHLILLKRDINKFARDHFPVPAGRIATATAAAAATADVDANHSSDNDIHRICEFATQMVEKGYAATHILELMENPEFLCDYAQGESRYEMMLCFHSMKRDIRSETLLMIFLLHLVFTGSKLALENIAFMS